MKKIWKRLWIPAVSLLLTIAFLILAMITDGDFSAVLSVIVMFLLIPFFILSLIWALVTGIKLTKQFRKDPELTLRTLDHSRTEQVKQKLQTDKQDYDALPASLRKREVIFRTIGISVSILGLIMMFTPLVLLGIFALIGGVALIFAGSAKDYNNASDNYRMVPNIKGLSLDQIFAGIQKMNTVYGSPYLGKFKTMNRPAIIFGPPAGSGMCICAYLNRSGDMFYLGECIISDSLCQRLTEPLFPAGTVDDSVPAEALCWSANSITLKNQLFHFFSEYLKTGSAKGFPEVRPESLFLFDEHFKLTGQRFALQSTDGKTIYEAEGTWPLKSFYIYENGREVFHVTKEIVHVMPTYRFYRNNTMIGIFEQDFSLVKDRFTLTMADEEITLEELGAVFGHNYAVYTGGKTIGLILENMNLTLENIVFDNSVIAVYDRRYLDIITALAIMAVREITRDRAGNQN